MTDQAPRPPVVSTPEVEPAPPSSASSGDRAAAAIAASRAGRSKTAKPARGGRFLAVGAAVGLSLGAVGVMSAAAQAGGAEPQTPAAVQRVVMVQPPAPQQIVIVLPGASTGEVVVDQNAANIAPPAKPLPPVASSVSKVMPITESEGS